MQAQTVAKGTVILLAMVLIPQVAVRLVTLLLRIEEAQGSNLGPETGYQNWDSWRIPVCLDKCRDCTCNKATTTAIHTLSDLFFANKLSIVKLTINNPSSLLSLFTWIIIVSTLHGNKFCFTAKGLTFFIRSFTLLTPSKWNWLQQQFRT